MDAQFWVVVIAAIGTLLLQVLGRLQAWHLSIVAIRSEVKGEAGRQAITKEVEAVHKVVNSQMTDLLNRLERSLEEASGLRTKVAQTAERDALTASKARETGAT